MQEKITIQYLIGAGLALLIIPIVTPSYIPRFHSESVARIGLFIPSV